jgi:hypothetical protein
MTQQMCHVSHVTFYRSGEKGEKEKTGRKDFTYRPKIACMQNRIYCPKTKAIHNTQNSILFFKLQNLIN